MTLEELIQQISARTALPKTTVRKVLDATTDEISTQIARQEPVSIGGLGRFSVQRRAQRTIRRVSDQRKILVGPRHAVKFRPGLALRTAAATHDDPSWQDPAMQTAWRVAESLVADLHMYHKDRAPTLAVDATNEQIDQACALAFGGLWRAAESTFAERVSAEIRLRSTFLIDGARRRWTRES